MLADLFNAELLGGGDILRNSVIPDRVREIMHAGELVPIEDYIAIVLPALSASELADKPLMFSSLGRWHGEEDGVIKATQASGHPIKAVIYISIDEETVKQRWHTLEHDHQRGDRHDDTIEILDVRLREYREKTLPVIDFYRQKGLLIEIDGHQSSEAVGAAIIAALVKLAD